MKIPDSRVSVDLTAHGDPDVMRLVEEPVPSPGPGELSIAVEAAGVNFGDALVRKGAYRKDAPLSFRPGFEVAGRVLEAGPGVDQVPGTPVAAFIDDGGYSSVVTVPADRAYPMPEGMSAVTGAGMLIQGVTAHYAVHRFGRTAADETVLVHAAGGGVGTIAIQLIALAGARAIGCASSDEKRQRALDLGAAAVIGTDPDVMRDEILASNDGARVDVILDSVGGPVFRPSMAALGTGGRYVVVGAASQEASKFDARRLMPRAQTLTGFVVAAVSQLDPAEPTVTFEWLWERLQAGELKLDIEEMPLEEVAEAHRRLESRALTGKMVLRMPASVTSG
ncbi:MAG: NADPH:quinone oxidoreductase family protein [Actinomycetota bacterium]|nr:NADPH:quinone oxidoreductase family protein [Actinomycetota bacterium]